MKVDKPKIYIWEKLHWAEDSNAENLPIALCPSNKCNCKLIKSKESYSRGEYKYYCIKCGYKITLNKSIEEKAQEFQIVLESENYRDSDYINIDGELTKICREQKDDDNYWVDVKLSKNKKDEVQIMVLAGNKKDKSKTQLFIEPEKEKMSFDQNNEHPREVFSKVTAIFKKSSSEINNKKR
jgi:hypothetical protein